MLIAFLIGLGSYHYAQRVIGRIKLESGDLPKLDLFEDSLEETRHTLGYCISGLLMAIGTMLTMNLVMPMSSTDFYAMFIDAAIIILLAMGITLTWIDLETKILPSKIIYWAGGGALALLIGSVFFNNGWSLLIGMAVGGMMYFLFWFLLWYWFPQGFGFGDVRLSFILGAFLGFLSPISAVVAFVAIWVIPLVFIILGMIFGIIGDKTKIAFGPWMILGAFVGLFWGGPIVMMLNLT